MLFQKGSEVLAKRQKRKSESTTDLPLPTKTHSKKTILTEEEKLNNRRKAAFPSLQQLDELSSSAWPASTSLANVTRQTLRVDQPFQNPLGSRFSSQSARINLVLQQGTMLEMSDTAFQTWQGICFDQKKFKQSSVYWWDENDHGQSAWRHKPLRPPRKEGFPLDLKAAKQARMAVDAFDLDVSTQLARDEAAEEEATEAGSDEDIPENASSTKGLENEMDGFIVPDDQPVEVLSKPKKSQRSQSRPRNSISYSDDDFDSALAQDIIIPQHRTLHTNTSKLAKIAKPSTVIPSSDEDDLPDLPDDPSIVLQSKTKSGSKPQKPNPKSEPAFKPIRRIIDLSSDDEPAPQPKRRRATSPLLASRDIQQRDRPQPPSSPPVRPVTAPKSPSRPTVPSRADVDSSDEEMDSMPRLPSASSPSSTQKRGNQLPTKDPVTQHVESPVSPVHTSATVGKPAAPPFDIDEFEFDDDAMFGSFIMDNNVLDQLDQTEAAQQQQQRDPSPATLAMPPPPLATKKQSPFRNAFTSNADESTSSSAVKLPPKARRTARVVAASSSPGGDDAPLLDPKRVKNSMLKNKSVLSETRHLSDDSEETRKQAASHKRKNTSTNFKPDKNSKRAKKKANPFIGGSQAICSDGSNNDTSDGNLSADPDTDDREALTDGEIEDGESMMRFYKDSLATQMPGDGGHFAERRYNGAAFKMRFGGGDPNFVATQRASSDPVSDYLESSFCVAGVSFSSFVAEAIAEDGVLFSVCQMERSSMRRTRQTDCPATCSIECGKR